MGIIYKLWNEILKAWITKKLSLNFCLHTYKYFVYVRLKVDGLLPFIMEYVWNGIHWRAGIVADKKCLYLAWRLQVESYLV